MKQVLNVIKLFAAEILIIFIYVLLVNNYIGKTRDKIRSDGMGYYEYLPSLFIHHDLIRKDYPEGKNPALYTRINATQVYTYYEPYKVNKYPCGTALLELPFFISTWLSTPLHETPEDGYQIPFQKSVFYAVLFYLGLGLFFLKKILEHFKIRKSSIILTQTLLALGTNVTHYANFEASFSHVYSLFAITTFIYFSISYFSTKRFRDFIFASILLGLIILLRQVNVLIVFFIPFLAGSFENLKAGIISLIEKPFKLLSGIFIVAVLFSMQCLLWYLQTGHFFVYSYQGESFNFLDPHFISILFSYKKGLFVYTPVVFLGVIAIFWLGYKRKYYLAGTWLGFFTLLTYVLSCWWSWYYGCSFGLRAYIDYFAIFFIPFAIMFDALGTVSRILFAILSLLTIPVNIIQTYQYKEYMLDWINMDKKKYWTAFLKTDETYNGLVFRKTIDYTMYRIEKEIKIDKTITVPKDSSVLIYDLLSSSVPNFEKVSIILVYIDNDYVEKNKSRILLTIDGVKTNHHYYWHNPFLVHYEQEGFNKWQTGKYDYEFTSITDTVEKRISLTAFAKGKNITLKNSKLRFLSPK